MSDVTIARYIPIAEAAAYRRDGWTVTAMPGNHGRYSMLATRVGDDDAGQTAQTDPVEARHR